MVIPAKVGIQGLGTLERQEISAAQNIYYCITKGDSRKCICRYLSQNAFEADLWNHEFEGLEGQSISNLGGSGS